MILHPDTKSLKMDIILRTYDGGNAHTGHRFISVSKSELVLTCLNSLVRTINKNSLDLTLTLLDDHSSVDTLKDMEVILEKCRVPSNIVSLPVHGNGPSIGKCYEWARENGREFIYFLEDDYLHFPSCIEEMAEAYLSFKVQLGKEVAIYPFDNPFSYYSEYIGPTMILAGTKRYWRTNFYSNYTLAFSKKVLIEHWEDIYRLSGYTDGQNGINEWTTIGQMWKKNVALMSPLSTLAFHMQFESNISYYADWKTLWLDVHPEFEFGRRLKTKFKGTSYSLL